jgi:osmoprotectant transport system substrate-binding protein
MYPLQLRALVAGVVLALAAYSPAIAQSIVVGGKGFTEQLLMAEMTSQLLRAKGFEVTSRVGFATTGIRREQEIGLVDIYWEYTGTSLTMFNMVVERLESHDAYARVKELDAKKGLIWLSPSKVNNTYALAMRQADAAARGIASISDLAAKVRRGERFRLASNLEFYLRSDGLTPLQQTYGFDFGPGNVVRMETGAIYGALRDSADLDVGLVFSTDGRVAAFGFHLLRDDRGFFPGYILAPVVRRRMLERHPEIATHLSALSAKLDNAAIARLNAKVDLQKMTVEEAASMFLKECGLL